jgi:hypothetical protein
MSKKILYLLGILLTIIVGTILHWYYSCDCGVKSGNKGTAKADNTIVAVPEEKFVVVEETPSDSTGGIGPKIEKLFHNEGIRTWKALSETTIEKCQQILDNAGENHRIHNPATWPKQCEMAYLGKWNELKEWQDKLTGGKE